MLVYSVLRFAEENFPVAGIDVDETKSEAISSGKLFCSYRERACRESGREGSRQQQISASSLDPT